MRYSLLLLLVFLQTALAGARPLSEEARISLLTSTPYEEEVFTVYGHAALRVCDPAQKIDFVFNYGVFSFDKPFFIYRFVKGETDYILGVGLYAQYQAEYLMRGSTITEQVLNLSADEKESIWQALQTNALPENREYRYNFFFDNCSTRPAKIVEDNVDGKVDYSEWTPPGRSFRDIINYCTRNKPWLTFGCDLIMGTPTDRVITPHEMMFLPSYLKEAFGKAVIEAEDGTSRPLVSQTNVLPSEPEEPETTFFTPLLCGCLCLIAVVCVTLWEIRNSKYACWLDMVLFTIGGLAGCLLFFLSFISEHPSMFPNWNLLWLHPFHFLPCLFFCLRFRTKAFYYYHFINFAALLIALAGWIFVPQHLNAAFIPLMSSLLLRSWMAIRRKPHYKHQGLKNIKNG